MYQLFFALTLVAAASAIPFHASCAITWTIPKACSDVNTAIVNQIKAWSDESNCPHHDNEKCLYTLVSSDKTHIHAKHTTPVHHYHDTLTFTFHEHTTGMCTVSATSRSDIFFAVLDHSTNYCNLHNLVTGAQLDMASGFMESTSNDVCTQYSSADCSKY